MQAELDQAHLDVFGALKKEGVATKEELDLVNTRTNDLLAARASVNFRETCTPNNGTTASFKNIKAGWSLFAYSKPDRHGLLYMRS